jgi:LysM repeat protein
MSEPDIPSSRYGRERLCPHCGTRVAQRAHTCFFCGAPLDAGLRRRPTIPWVNLLVFALAGAIIVFWWTREPLFQEAFEASQAKAGVGGSSAQLMIAEAPAPPTVAPSSTPTVEPTATPLPTATALPTPIRYKVQPGDTLQLIAGLYGCTVKAIIEANGLSADGFIRAGDELLIPATEGSAAPAASPTASGGTLVYAVQPGDTLYSIAMRFGSRVDWIAAANNLKVTDLLQINQSLLVPLSPNTPTPTPTPSPSPTPTEGPRYSAPDLLLPADGDIVSGVDEVLLSWASVGVLEQDEWYVVKVEVVGGAQPSLSFWTKGTSWRLTPDYRLPGQAVTKFAWQVQVFTGSPEQPGVPSSPPSALRHFTWQ